MSWTGAVSQQAELSLQTPAPVPSYYRRVIVSQKRKSDVSSSVAGANLRKKRRRLKDPVLSNQPDTQAMADPVLSFQPNTEAVAEHFDGGEITKREYFEYFSLPWPPASELLSLDQGQFLLEKRLMELGMSLSPSQKMTPKDGACMFHALHDQITTQISMTLRRMLRSSVIKW